MSPEIRPKRAFPWYPILAIALATGIFVVDTWSSLGTAIAVLYTLVIIVCARFLDRNGVIAVAGVCMALALTSFVIEHAHEIETEPAIRLIISLCAIAFTAFLTVKSLAAIADLQQKAALLDQTRDGICVTNMQGVIVYWNRGAEELYGWSASETVGRDAAMFLAMDEASRTEIHSALLKDGQWEGEFDRKNRSGSELKIMARFALQRDNWGNPLSIMETSNDFTARKRAEDALHSAKAELWHMARVTTLGELTASIAHEVNQPLAAVVTNGEAGLRWLSRDPPNLDAVRTSVEKMVANGRRASDVVARLRALVRRSELEQLPLDLNSLVQDTIVLLQREIEIHQTALDLRLDPDSKPVSGDRVQLQQVVINLLINALQAMEAIDGHARILRIRTYQEENEDARYVVLEVADTGPGLSAEHMEKLFNAFYTTKQNGLGMGLSICRSIIEAHGGWIEAAANGESGAKFSVRLIAGSNGVH